MMNALMRKLRVIFLLRDIKFIISEGDKKEKNAVTSVLDADMVIFSMLCIEMGWMWIMLVESLPCVHLFYKRCGAISLSEQEYC